MLKDIESKIIIYNGDIDSEGYRPPSKYYILNAFGGYTFFKCRARGDAQAMCDAYYGRGKYIIRVIVKAIVR